MTFKEVQGAFKNGRTAFKKLAKKAETQVVEVGEKATLKMEEARLKAAVDSLISKLGEEVYSAFVDMNHATVGRDSSAVRGILDEIKGLKATIERKEKQYRAIGMNTGI